MQQVSAARESHRQAQRYLARKLLLTIYGAWFLALAVGTLHYAGDDEIAVNRNELPLRHIDYIFRTVGGVVIFAVWGLRALMKQALHLRGDDRRVHIWIPAVYYAFQAGLRSLLHQFHNFGVIFSPHKWFGAATTVVLGGGSGNNSKEKLLDYHHEHIMSDHVLLAATVIGGLACEMVVLHLSFAHRRHKISPLLLRGLAVTVTALALLVSAECYYTAKYFHPPGEIIAGAVFGLILFQVPLLFLSARLLQAHEDEDVDNDDRISG
ncbi:hypothetical protein NADE_006908 [Nannochloris sp. 'desiccata']|nr:hypothetical protein KSW81_002383 [Chlorella desiccata (nom. nud.)]KAH7617122.1 hypothetical protein NADE_006908 [Chlorella desiccata (nom. nud.)]